MAHTIILFQPGEFESRTYWDFESLNDALECKSLFSFAPSGLTKVIVAGP